MSRAEWIIVGAGASLVSLVGVVLFALAGYSHMWVAVVSPYVVFAAVWWLLNQLATWKRRRRDHNVSALRQPRR